MAYISTNLNFQHLTESYFQKFTQTYHTQIQANTRVHTTHTHTPNDHGIHARSSNYYFKTMTHEYSRR